MTVTTHLDFLWEPCRTKLLCQVTDIRGLSAAAANILTNAPFSLS